MDDVLYEKHIRAGLVAGRDRTCGKKVDFKSEATAVKVAVKLSAKYGEEKEGYPCAFCAGWHVGRKMSEEELNEYAWPQGFGTGR